jgi:hypothetical protein
VLVSTLVVALAACRDDEADGPSDASVPPTEGASTAAERPDDPAELVQGYLELLLDGETELAAELRCSSFAGSRPGAVAVMRGEVGSLLLTQGAVDVREVELMEDAGDLGEVDLWSAVLESRGIEHDPFFVAVSDEGGACVGDLGTMLALRVEGEAWDSLSIGAQASAAPDELIAVDGIARTQWEVRRYSGEDEGVEERDGEGVVDGVWLGIEGIGEYASTVEVTRFETAEQAQSSANAYVGSAAVNLVEELPSPVPAALGLRLRSAPISGVRPPDLPPWRDMYWLVCGDTRIVTSTLTSTIPADAAAERVREMAERAGGCDGAVPSFELRPVVGEA